MMRTWMQVVDNDATYEGYMAEYTTVLRSWLRAQEGIGWWISKEDYESGFLSVVQPMLCRPCKYEATEIKMGNISFVHLTFARTVQDKD